ncbi:hypothetical protein [Jiangella alkaliphila]|uniref:Enoyl reductase n=1 Tax=Jiangella alkaliphila TaxID=419479 RepID=A0A1H2HJT4_9ACTN|nr:hypothetical protein [Jiangella alkaliphila]SDU32084.1 hypothetical protein SAMN04488563_1084 [Jiangella alkaliphila]
MLTPRRVSQVLMAAVVLLAGLLGAVAPGQAAEPAADPCYVWLEVSPGVFEYVNICPDPDEEGGGEDDGSGGNGPRCDLTEEPYDEFCLGTKACRADIPSTLPEDKWPPEETRPSPDHIFTFVQCRVPGQEELYERWRWIEPYEGALPGLGWQALGRLETPAFTMTFEPSGMTYVGADTRYLLDGLGDGEIIGSVAGPLQATGELSHVEIDPGDGSETIDCDPDLRTRACEHVYLEMSHEQTSEDIDGQPGFPAQARLVYDVTFTMGGVEVSLPGVPDTLESPWNGTVVPVGEIQALVRTR